MSIHTHGPVCQGCDLRLKTAHPYLAQWYYTKVKPNHPECHIAWAWRNQIDQEHCFQDGKSKLHWPDSPHNWTDHGAPCSLALDLFCIDADNIGTWPPGFYVTLNNMNLEEKEPIQWGGSWKTFKDTDHFQLDLSQLPDSPGAA